MHNVKEIRLYRRSPYGVIRVSAMRLSSHDLTSNWAYMVIAALAWNLKSWLAILTVDKRSAEEISRMQFRRFARSVILIPCQVVRSGRRTILRILSYSNWIPLAHDNAGKGDSIVRQRREKKQKRPPKSLKRVLACRIRWRAEYRLAKRWIKG